MTQAQSKSYGGVKKKLMGAICMLLVASIMVVSSTYAWFTLSTAPEITGISTSVGANGNLEMALLNTATYGDTSLIKSAVGNSMDAGTAVTEANVTWGNLVNLSDKSYGMTNITLMPAQLNVKEGKLETSPLATAQYGADGRVTGVAGTTVSATYDGTSFKYVQDHQDYGVRAVGESSAITPRQIAFNAAKSGYLSAVAAAHNATVSAVNSNQNAFILIAMDVLGGKSAADTKYTVEQMQAMVAIANGIKTDFSTLTVALKNAIIAKAAASDIDDDSATAVSAALASVAKPTDLQTALNSINNVNGIDSIKAVVGEIVTADTKLDNAISGLSTKITAGKEVPSNEISTEISNILGTNIPHKSVKEKDTDRMPKELYLTGGDGALATLAKYNGTFKLAEVATIPTYAGYGKLDDTGKKWENTNAELASLTADIKTLTTKTAGATNTNITDFYGYIMDMAFRTNAATSNLQLQTAGINRIYQDENVTGNALQGAGSTVTMSNAAGLTADQSAKLLSAVRVVFFDPADGTVFGTAGIKPDSISRTPDSTKADLYMIESSMTIQQKTISLGQDAYSEDANGVYAIRSDYPAVQENVTYSNYAATLSPTKWKALPAKTTTYTSDAVETTLKADKAAITALGQSDVKKVSVLVYMDGNMIDNSAVPNAATAGMLTMNLQFSSSADLVPMSNANLRKADKENVTSTLTIDGLENVTVRNDPYSASIAGANQDKDPVQSVQWSSSNNAVATVDASGSVKIVGGGTARIVALVRTTHNVYVASKALNVNVASNSAKILVDGKTLGDNNATINVYPGENFGLKQGAVLTAVLSPNNTTDTIKGVKWEGKNGVTVEETTGKITDCNIVGDTAATIKATIATKTTENDGAPNYTDGAVTVTITVKNQAAATAATLSPNNNVTLTAKDANDVDVTQVTGVSGEASDKIVGVYAASNVSGVEVSVSNDYTVKANASGCSGAANGSIVVVTVTKFGAVLTNVIPVTVNAPAVGP